MTLELSDIKMSHRILLCLIRAEWAERHRWSHHHITIHHNHCCGNHSNAARPFNTFIAATRCKAWGKTYFLSIYLRNFWTLDLFWRLFQWWFNHFGKNISKAEMKFFARPHQLTRPLFIAHRYYYCLKC